jgi:hypothetical protein
VSRPPEYARQTFCLAIVNVCDVCIGGREEDGVEIPMADNKL